MEELKTIQTGEFLQKQFAPIPETVQEIEAYAFMESYGMNQTFQLPKGLELIGKAGFFSCDYTKDVVFPATIKQIGKFAFKNTNIHSVKFSGKLSEIQDGTFRNCRHLTKVVLPEGLQTIEDNAFAGCCALEEIVFPKGLLKIGNGAFKGCQKLKKLVIPSTVREIGESAFEDCGTLEELQVLSGCVKIAKSAFTNCFRLISDRVKIPFSKWDKGIFPLIPVTEKIFQGKTVYVTGLFGKLPKCDIKAIVQRYGGKITESLSKKTSLVIAGNSAKLDKAQSLHIPIISKEELIAQILSGYHPKTKKDGAEKLPEVPYADFIPACFVTFEISDCKELLDYLRKLHKKYNLIFKNDNRFVTFRGDTMKIYCNSKLDEFSGYRRDGDIHGWDAEEFYTTVEGDTIHEAIEAFLVVIQKQTDDTSFRCESDRFSEDEFFQLWQLFQKLEENHNILRYYTITGILHHNDEMLDY